MVAAPAPALAGVINPVALVMVTDLTAPELAAVAMAPVHRAAVVLVPELAQEPAPALAPAPAPAPVLAPVLAPAPVLALAKVLAKSPALALAAVAA